MKIDSRTKLGLRIALWVSSILVSGWGYSHDESHKKIRQEMANIRDALKGMLSDD